MFYKVPTTPSLPCYKLGDYLSHLELTQTDSPI